MHYGRQLAAVDTVLVVDVWCALRSAIDLSPCRATKVPQPIDTRMSCSQPLNGRSGIVVTRVNCPCIEVTGLFPAEISDDLRSSRPPMPGI